MVSIPNVKENPSYQRYYQKREAHETLEKEMLFLGKIINLQFVEDCNFDEEIIFDQACSQRLKSELLLHVNVDYIKRLMCTQNIYSLFNTAKIENNKFYLFKNLPYEVTEKILDEACINKEVVDYQDLQQAKTMRP